MKKSKDIAFKFTYFLCVIVVLIIGLIYIVPTCGGTKEYVYTSDDGISSVYTFDFANKKASYVIDGVEYPTESMDIFQTFNNYIITVVKGEESNIDGEPNPIVAHPENTKINTDENGVTVWSSDLDYKSYTTVNLYDNPMLMEVLGNYINEVVIPYKDYKYLTSLFDSPNTEDYTDESKNYCVKIIYGLGRVDGVTLKNITVDEYNNIFMDTNCTTSDEESGATYAVMFVTPTDNHIDQAMNGI